MQPLKQAYSLLAASWEEERKLNVSAPTKSVLQQRSALNLVKVFGAGAPGEALARARCDVNLHCVEDS